MSNSLKLEQLKGLCYCEYCSKLLVKPITLQCGASICESHLDQIIKGLCKFCDELHPKGPYQVNRKLNKMIELEVNSIKMSPKFDACKKSIDKAKEFVDKIENPENFIYEHFQQIKLNVDLRREELKLQIEDYSNEILCKIDQTQKDCIKMAKEIHTITKDIETYKADLNILIQGFDSFEFNDEKYDDIRSKVTILQPKLEDILDDYKFSLLDNSDHEFKIEDISMEEVFGSFISYLGGKTCLNSKMINNKQVIELMNICEFQKQEKFQLLYRASEDGFNSDNFHQKCDGIKNTLTIIKSTNGNIFGGYTGAAWSSSGDYISDTNSFIFSLINQSNDPFKAKCTDNQYEIVGNESHGPTYCSAFHISSNSNTNLNSFSSFGSYIHGTYGDAILAGSKNFQTVEIEVFEKFD